jgi:glycosyltransferase involved in cell wall biosynthesis
VTSGWLQPLVLELEQDPGVGAVGPKFIYPDGILQEAGAFVDSNGNSVQVGKGQNPNSERFNSRKEVHYVSAACVALRKADFEKVGGFNFIYEPAYYEDVDLCFSIRALGLSVVYQPNSTVVHLESQTTSGLNNSFSIGGTVESNRKKFLDRWGKGKTPTFYESDGHKRIPSGGAQKKTIVVYTPFELVFGGGEKYILSVAETFSKLGWKTVIATRHSYSRLRLSALGNQFGLDLSLVELALVSDLNFKIDFFVSLGNEVYPPVSPPGARNIHICQFPFPNHAKSFAEVARIEKLDLVIVYSEFARKTYLKAAEELGYTNLRVEIISPPVSDLMDRHVARKPKKIVSVGRFFQGGHDKNQRELIRAFSTLVKIHPDAELVLVGGLANGKIHRDYLDSCQRLAEGLPIVFEIDCDISKLKSLVSSSGVYWHGSGLGVDELEEPERCEHFGISVLEAMGVGSIPIVVGNGGPEEIVRFGLEGFHYRTIQGLIRRTDIVFNLDSNSICRLRDGSVARFEFFKSLSFENRWASVLKSLR